MRCNCRQIQPVDGRTAVSALHQQLRRTLCSLTIPLCACCPLTTTAGGSGCGRCPLCGGSTAARTGICTRLMVCLTPDRVRTACYTFPVTGAVVAHPCLYEKRHPLRPASSLPHRKTWQSLVRSLPINTYLIVTDLNHQPRIPRCSVCCINYAGSENRSMCCRWEVRNKQQESNIA